MSLGLFDDLIPGGTAAAATTTADDAFPAPASPPAPINASSLSPLGGGFDLRKEIARALAEPPPPPPVVAPDLGEYTRRRNALEAERSLAVQTERPLDVRRADEALAALADHFGVIQIHEPSSRIDLPRLPNVRDSLAGSGLEDVPGMGALSRFAGAGAALYNAGAGILAGATDERNLPLMAAPPALPLRALFAIQGLQAVGTESPEALKAYREGRYQDALEHALNAGMGAMFAAREARGRGGEVTGPPMPEKPPAAWPSRWPAPPRDAGGIRWSAMPEESGLPGSVPEAPGALPEAPAAPPMGSPAARHLFADLEPVPEAVREPAGSAAGTPAEAGVPEPAEAAPEPALARRQQTLRRQQLKADLEAEAAGAKAPAGSAEASPVPVAASEETGTAGESVTDPAGQAGEVPKGSRLPPGVDPNQLGKSESGPGVVAGKPQNRHDLHVDLTRRGFQYRPSPTSKHVTYLGPGERKVTVKPTGEVIPTQKVGRLYGQGKYSERQDYHGNRLPDQSHSTGHFVESLDELPPKP